MMFFRYAPVAQLDRVSDSDSEGRAFESHHEEFLEEHDYSKEEVKEGAQSLADRKGLGLLGEGLMPMIAFTLSGNQSSS